MQKKMKNREQSKASATANDDVSLIIYFRLLRRANFSQKRKNKFQLQSSLNWRWIGLVNLKFESFVYSKIKYNQTTKSGHE